MDVLDQILARFAEAAARPLDYAKQWKAAKGKPVVGLLPMHFPGEIAHSAGALPTILQEDDEPVAAGLGSIFSFYCGFNRSLCDQLVRGEFNDLDAVMCGDHCVQLLGTADAIRARAPQIPVLFNQLITSMSMPWAFDEARRTFVSLKEELERVLTRKITDDDLRASIRLFNKDRGLMRRLYELRRAGKISISARQLQQIVKSSMVMDKAEHIGLLEQLLADLDTKGSPSNAIRVYLSGHFCHAPKPEILDLIEECGAIVVDDDLFHGYRYIATDMDEAGDPLDALTKWYFAHNREVPCATLADKNADLDDFLLNAVNRSHAQGLIILLVKFCEPHMYVYPEIKEKFEKAGIPHLLVETEHDGIPLEALKTRLETFLEIARRRAAA